MPPRPARRQEAFPGVRIVKSFARFYEVSRYNDTVEPALPHRVTCAAAVRHLGLVIGLIAYLLIALVLWFGSRKASSRAS